MLDENNVQTYPLYRWADRHFEYNQVSTAVQYIVDRVGSPCDQREPIVIIGHSWGGNSAIVTARRLNAKGYKVDFLATLDPVTNTAWGLIVKGIATTKRPPNVSLVWNFRQNNDRPVGSKIVTSDRDVLMYTNDAQLKAAGVLRTVRGHREIDDDRSIYSQIEAQSRTLHSNWGK
jgi:pimeloyl-ACP methyl ester carboxylesterase